MARTREVEGPSSWPKWKKSCGKGWLVHEAKSIIFADGGNRSTGMDRASGKASGRKFAQETQSTMVEPRDRVTRARPLNRRDLGGVIQRIYSKVNVYLEDIISTFLESSRPLLPRRGGMLSPADIICAKVFTRGNAIADFI